MVMNLCTYNIRGLNNKIPYVRDFIKFHKLSFVVLVETHVQASSAQSVTNLIAPRFTWLFNYEHHNNGRIWIGFDNNIWKVELLSCSAQHASCSVLHLCSGTRFYISFIYALCSAVERRTLWAELINFSSQLSDSDPWCAVGDFNVCNGPSESNRGNHWTRGMLDFNDCMHQAGLSDLRTHGPPFTWWDSNISSPTYKRLDRCIVNPSWLHLFPLSQATILQRGLSDHCPIDLHVGVQFDKLARPFQFFNYFSQHRDFKEIVGSAWAGNIEGNPWFILTCKLKKVKAALKLLNNSHGNVHSKVSTARSLLLNHQESMPLCPTSDQIIHEKHLIENFNSVLLEEESFLKQKSRVTWLKCGDSNNKFFFNACKSRWNCNKILQINDNAGNSVHGQKDVAQVAIDYFSDLLGSSSSTSAFPENLQLKMLSESQILDLQRPFVMSDVYGALKSMAKNKSPGPDGFTVEFYLAAWDIIGTDVCNAIMYFFSSKHLPKIVNSAALALVPKSQTPSTMNDFRPIACCNVLYKCITKMLSFRIKSVISSIISAPQAAFIPGRKLGDNILLAQALLRDYHLHSGPARCAFKIDLCKAFDTLNWGFLRRVMASFGFPALFIDWTMSCISGTMLSVKLNGAIEGYFAAQSGLRQGDPMSPYLFVMAMEVLTACLSNHCSRPPFKFHWKTKDLGISHITFADDILLFCHGDEQSVSSLMAGLHIFTSCSGMQLNISKSQFYTANVDWDTREFINHSTGISEGSLPVNYLGIPLITSKLNSRDCMPLIMKVKNRIDCWHNICLNQAGRLQLIKSVLYGIQGFWSSHIILPKFVLKNLQTLFVKFLWGGNSANTRMVKVSWSDCCFPKANGGLGLRDLCTWNTAAFLFQLWRISQTPNSSLWLMWFKRTYLKRNSIWTMNIPSKASWCVRKMLHLRPLALRYIRYHVGMASTFRFWLDPWLGNTPIITRCGPSIVSIAESNINAEVGQYMLEASWNLPSSNHFTMVELRRRISAISIQRRDSVTWLDDPSTSVSVASIFRHLCVATPSPAWCDAVWNRFSIPKCAFTFWLALKGRLLTRDRMRNFRMATDLRCIMCYNAIETHDHLFGSCPFITEVLSDHAFVFTGDLASYNNGLFLLNRPRGIRKSIGVLFLSIVVYLTWKERNDRAHNLDHHLSAQIIKHNAKRLLREKLHSSATFQKAVHNDYSLISYLY